MLVVPEITGAFTIPYGIGIGTKIWQLLNETGLFLVPFALAVLKGMIEARSQGAMEGSSAALSIKYIEKDFITKFAILLFFVMPFGSISDQVSFKAYSCRGGDVSVLGDAATVVNIQPNLPNAAFIGERKLPLGVGFIHTLAVASSQTLIGQTACDANLNQSAMNSDNVAIAIDSHPLDYSIREFYKQCYVPAFENIQTAIAKGKFNGGVRLMPKQEQFFSAELYGAYLGTTPGISSGPMTMTIPKVHWVGFGEFDDPTNPSVTNASCNNASQSIYNEIVDWFADNWKERLELAQSTSIAYQGREGPVSPQEVFERYAHQALIDTSAGTDKLFNTALNSEAQKSSTTMSEKAARVATLIGQLEQHVAVNLYGQLGPVIISALIAFMYVAMPLVLILSGLSIMVLATFMYLIIFLFGTYYILDIAWYVDTILLSLANSTFGISTTGDLLGYLQTLSPIILLGGWSLMGTLMGINAIPVISALIASVSLNAAKSGVAAGTFIGRVALNAASGGMASGAANVANEAAKATQQALAAAQKFFGKN